ncbi:hypothetical protein vseg_012085 [Gypsophila vaccaria]
MEKREDLRRILELLPLNLNSTTLEWPTQVTNALIALSKGPSHSRVDSGEVLFVAISDLRNSLSLSSHPFHPSASHGFSLFFDEFLSRSEAAKWFGEVVPMMANLLLRLPTLLESHYQYSDIIMVGVDTGLRLLESQQPGIVFLGQELIAALLSCSLFCLFPTANRGAKHLPKINFDFLFANLYESYHENNENKIKCLIHYFERISSCIPTGFVSFERKVLTVEPNVPLVSYPDANMWSNSRVSLCPFEVCSSGLIEDQLRGALEVDFANKYLGGGALSRGCVQEEIRFMINPELIAGRLFLSCMSDNEAIEIVGAERFSNYSGYASTFRYAGDHVDRREVDSLGRRNTRIVAIDALSRPGSKQYRIDYLLREANKAFCGFLDTSKYAQYQTLSEHSNSHEDMSGSEAMDTADASEIRSALIEGCAISSKMHEGRLDPTKDNSERVDDMEIDCVDVGIVTGNWGCGAFGGDPEVKAMIQWLAASQALRPFVSYHTFELEKLQNLDLVTQWILAHKWTVGDLWTMLVDYCSKRRKGDPGFFSWLVPTIDQ